jgi:hypothetical protein
MLELFSVRISSEKLCLLYRTRVVVFMEIDNNYRNISNEGCILSQAAVYCPFLYLPFFLSFVYF